MKKKCRYILHLLALVLLVLGFGAEAGAAAGFESTAVSMTGNASIRLTKKKKKKKKSKTNSNGNNSSSAQSEENRSGGALQNAQGQTDAPETESALSVEEDGVYTSKEEVAAYLHAFGHLPDNFITKNEAKKLGWVSSEGNLDVVAPGKSIGGDHFGNYEGQLPEKKGRSYYECDIDYEGGRRGAKRIIYSDDGLIFYTEDHYTTFEQLYPQDAKQ